MSRKASLKTGATPAVVESLSQPPDSGAEASEVIVQAPQANDGRITVWPLRSYHDQGETKRVGNQGYAVTKSHAVQLMARGLATDQDPQHHVCD